MKKEISPQIIFGVVAVVLIVVAIIGYNLFGGTKKGVKPQLDPVLNKMYGPHPIAGDSSSSQNMGSATGQGK